jgi:hypothetical protein
MQKLFIATALILSQFIILGCCDSDMSAANMGAMDNSLNNLNTISDTNSLIPIIGSIASVGSFDKHSVFSYGNGPMGLASNLETGLTQTNDGSILKSRNLAMLSYGSDLMNINDFSSLTGTDTLGNEFGMQSEKTVTLKNCVYPFALMKEDLTTVSGDGTNINDASKTLLLLPDTYSADDLAMFTSAFGGSGIFNIKTFKYTFDINAFLKEVGSTDLSAYNMRGTLSQLNDASSALLLGTNMTGILHDVINEMVAEINRQNDPNNQPPQDPNQWDSNGGVTCYWAEYK